MFPNRESQIIHKDAIKSHKEVLKNSWVIVQLVNGMVYSMSINEINDLGVKGFLHLGLVPEYITPGHTWPIYADSLILYDYIDSLIILE